MARMTASVIIDMPMTGKLRSGESQVLSVFDMRTPAITIGSVARTIQIAKRRFQSRKSRRTTAPIEPNTSPRTSLQK